MLSRPAGLGRQPTSLRGRESMAPGARQTGVVKTIELILCLAPMNQLDLSATPIRACFQDKPDLRPFTAVPNKVPLDEMNPPLHQLRGAALRWAKKSLELDFDKEDEADENTLNRILWHSVRG